MKIGGAIARFGRVGRLGGEEKPIDVVAVDYLNSFKLRN